MVEFDLWRPTLDPNNIILIVASGEVSWEAEYNGEKFWVPGDRPSLNSSLDIYYVTLDKFLNLSEPEFPQLLLGDKNNF